VRHLLNTILVDPSANENYAIRRASKNGHIEVVRLLLSDECVDPSDDTNVLIQLVTTIMQFDWHQRKDTLKWLDYF
jgi:hypothetical protein